MWYAAISTLFLGSESFLRMQSGESEKLPGIKKRKRTLSFDSSIRFIAILY